MSEVKESTQDLQNLPKWLLWSFLASVLFLLLPIPADNIKYIVASITVLGIPVFGMISKKHKLIYPVGWLPYLLLGYVAFSFISVFWSTDPTMALRESFNWLLLAMVTFMVSVLIANSERTLHLLSKLLSVFFIFFLIFHLGAVQLDIGLNSGWNALMSRNRYYTTTLLTCLSPFMIFYPSKSQFIRFSKIISVVLLANLLFLTGARGALLAFSIILLLKYWNFYAQWKFRYFGVLIGAVIIVSGIYFLNTSPKSLDFTFVQEYREQLASRVHLNQNSIASIQERPLLGVGAGQWFNDIYKHGVEGIVPFNNPDETIRIRSHNLYFKQLVELGVVGAGLFFAVLFGALFRFKDEWTLLSGYSKAAWASILSFLIVSYFYATAIQYEHFFSGIALIAFLSLGILMATNSERKKAPFGSSYAMIICGFVCLLWFVSNKVNYESFKGVKSDIGAGWTEDAIKKLEALYYPFYNASYDYKTSYSQLLAEQYAIMGNKEKAQNYFQDAIKSRPNDEMLLRSYVNYCINLKTNIEEAKKYAERLIAIQSNHTENQRLLKRLKSLE